jgi:hypothetical protein
VKTISSLEALKVSRGDDYVCSKVVDGFVRIPYAYGRSITKTPPKPIQEGASPISCAYNLHDTQLGPALSVKTQLSRNGYALLSLDCADGKTAIAFWQVTVMTPPPARVLVVVHREFLRAQISKEITAITGCEPWIATKPEEISEGARFVVCMVHVLDKLPEWYKRSVDVMIVDEAHRIVGPVFGLNLLSITPKRLIGMTATPGNIESRDLDPVVKLLYGNAPITSMTHRPFNVLRILTPFKPECRLKWQYDPRTRQRKQILDWGLVQKSLATNEERNKMIVSVTSFFLSVSESAQIIVLCKLVKDHIKLLEPMYESEGIVTGAVYGGNEPPEVSRCYLGTYGKAEAGFDEKALKGYNNKRINIVLMADDTLDPRQAAGRGRRAECPLFIELLDEHDIIRKNHADTRAKWYRSNGAIAIDTVRWTGYMPSDPKWKSYPELELE